MTSLDGTCTCGEIAFEMSAAPLFRLSCHCSICRRYHGTDKADATVFRARDFEQKPGGHVTYKVHRQPPLLRRGTCDRCAAPVLETLVVPGLPKLMLIPSRWITQQEALPDPAFHMFYDKRLQDAEDALPKIEGYWRSEIAFSKRLLACLMSPPAA